MAGIDEVLERLVADGEFRAALAREPAAALAGYELTRGDLELLASRLDDGDDAERTVEQRTSKSAMLALLASFAGPGGGGTAGPGHEGKMDVVSWSWGETQDAAPDDLAVPESAEGELFNKSQGKVEYTWKIEEGVKAELDPDALATTEGPGATGPGVPSTDAEGIIPIDGLAGDDTAEMEDVGLIYGKVDFEAEPLDPALADAGDEPEEAVNVYLKLGDVKGEAQDPASSQSADQLQAVDEVSWSWGEAGDGVSANPPDDNIVGINPPDDSIVGVNPPDDGIVGGNPPDDGIVGGNPPDDNIVGQAPPDDGIVGVAPPDDGIVGGVPPDDGIVGGNPPDDSIVGSNPPDDSIVGANPPDDGIVGINPPDDSIVGSLATDGSLAARTNVAAAMDVDDIMEIGDV